MHKILFTIPGLGFSLHGFSLMLMLGTVGGLFITAWRAGRERIDPDDVFGLAAWLLSGGFIGARVLYVAQHREAVEHFSDIFKIWQGGIVFYGCIIGGLIGSVIYWIRNPFPFRAMADAVAPALVLGSALGRIGCFLNGCCFGGPCNLPIAVRFPSESPVWVRQVQLGLISPMAPRTLGVHPTQLYAALDGLLLLALLTWYYPRRRRDGEVMALLMVTYPVTRFLIECLRADEGPFFAGMTISQTISVVLFLSGLLTWAYLLRLPRIRHADLTGTPGQAQAPARARPRPAQVTAR
jgi:phosphatidylglycerol---prolipoprotein diacylglyceryl transferase